MALLSDAYKSYYPPPPQPEQPQPQQEMVTLPPPSKQPAVGVRQIALMLLIGVLAIILVDSLINKYPSL